MRKSLALTRADEGKFRFANHDYGKSNVRLLHVERRGLVHHAHELKVSTRLQLSTLKDYLHADNADIVATDTQKNTIHVLARKYGIAGPEQFALLLARHFLKRYSHVVRAIVNVEEVPWQRMEMSDGPHNHAFMFCPTSVHYCSVELNRLESGELNEPVIRAGLRGLRVLKTTQSKFVDFHKVGRVKFVGLTVGHE
ncbi:hypothetical protein B566_EDAN005517 [Ephemera danica]|nr:hypothetical protein B566_EDAN005517 [Ephemera danica]